VAAFAAGLMEGPWTDEDGKTRSRKADLVSLLSDELRLLH
jgi:hypothetical protein